MASNVLDSAVDIVFWWGSNLKTNFTNTINSLHLINVVRLIAIVGGYLLLRPYLIKLGAKVQRREHENAENTPEEHPAKISANSIRGQVDIPENSDDEGEAKGADVTWGKKARKRQRQVLKKVLEAAEKKLQEEQDEDEDADLEEFLNRYQATGREVVQ